MFESIPSKEPSAVDTWFEGSRKRTTDSLLSLEIEIASALDDGDRSRVFSLQQDKAVLESSSDHLAELGMYLHPENPAESIENLSKHASRLGAVLANQNHNAKLLDSNLDSLGKVLIGTEEMKTRAKLAATTELLNALAYDIENR